MLLRENYTAEHILRLREETGADPSILERTVYRWFKGTILPSVDNLLRLSELFHVHMEDLLVKQYSKCAYKYCPTVEVNSIRFIKRMQAYYSLLAA